MSICDQLIQLIRDQSLLKITLLCNLLENEELCEIHYILSITLNGFHQAFLCNNNLRIYFKKKKLITKCLNRNYNEQITFTNDNQIILQRKTDQMTFTQDKQIILQSKAGICITDLDCFIEYPINIYNFITKCFTNCDVGGCSEKYYYEYCPINDIILIPTGNPMENQISVWGVSERKFINQISVQGYLSSFKIKMNCSGQYFFVRDLISKVLYIYSYGQQVTLQRKISYLQLNLNQSWNIEWIFDDQYFLLHKLHGYMIMQNDNEAVDCSLYKLNATKAKNEGNKQIIHAFKTKIHIILQMRGQFIDYYSIIL